MIERVEVWDLTEEMRGKLRGDDYKERPRLVIPPQKTNVYPTKPGKLTGTSLGNKPETKKNQKKNSGSLSPE